MTAVPEIRIEPVEHDLTDVSFIAWARDGSIAIGQAQDQAIRFFNAQGIPAGRIGRSGEGPGEFRMMLRAGWLGDTLWVFDNMLRRVTLIAPPVHLLRSLPVPQTARLASGVEIKHGTVAGYRSAKDLDLLAIIESPLRSAYARVALPAATATLIYSDSLAECSTEVPGGRTFYFPFCPRGAKRVNPQGGSLVAVRQSRAQQERGEFTVTRAGARPFTRTYFTDSPPLPRATVDSAVDAMLKTAKLAPAQASAARSRLPRPSRYAAATMVIPGRDGSIFVGHSGPVLRRWTVLRSDGSAAFEFDLPKATVVHAVTLQAFWAVDVDEDGVETPVRYRLVPRK